MYIRNISESTHNLRKQQEYFSEHALLPDIFNSWYKSLISCFNILIGVVYVNSIERDEGSGLTSRGSFVRLINGVEFLTCT